MVHHRPYMESIVEEIVATRKLWETKLADTYGMKVYPSSTNFIYAVTDDYLELWQFLKDNNVNVSKFAPNGLRISIGTNEEMAALTHFLDIFYKK